MSKSVTLTIPEPHYTLFDVKRSGQPEIIVVNDALLSFAHSEVFPWHLRITIEAKELVDNGMPSPAEAKILDRIGDAIEAAISEGRTENRAENALFLARSTWNGLRELLFQVHDPEIANTSLQSMLHGGKAEREWDYRMEHDTEWTKAGYVFQLFPQARGHDA